MRKRNFKNITLKKLIDYIFVINWKYFLWYIAAYFPCFQDIMLWKVRPALWRMIGVKVGKNVFIGYGVYLDIGGAHRIEIGDNVIITAQCLLLAHKRDINHLYDGKKLQNEIPFIEGYIKIEKNVSLGMRTMVLPNVTIGENSVIGAMSLVAKDVQSNVLATGNPLKIIRNYDK